MVYTTDISRRNLLPSISKNKHKKRTNKSWVQQKLKYVATVTTSLLKQWCLSILTESGIVFVHIRYNILRLFFNFDNCSCPQNQTAVFSLLLMYMCCLVLRIRKYTMAARYPFIRWINDKNALKFPLCKENINSRFR